MKRALLILLAAPIHWSYAADGGEYFSLKEKSYTANGVQVHVAHLEYRDPAHDIWIRKDVIETSTLPPITSVSAHGIVTRDGIAVGYSEPLRGQALSNAEIVLESGRAQAVTNASVPLVSLNALMTRPPVVQVPANVLAAQQQIRQFQVASAEKVRDWYNVNRYQLQSQKNVMQSVREGATQIAAAADRHLVEASLAAFAADWTLAELPHDLRALELSSVVKSQTKVEALAFSPEAQRLLIAQLPDVMASDPLAAGELAADIASPLNINRSADLEREFVNAGVIDGVLPGTVILPTGLKFADPYLGDARLRVQNYFQASAFKYAAYLAGEGRDRARAAEIYLQAARKAEAAGDIARARDLTARAQALIQSPDLSAGANLRAYGDALRAYLGPGTVYPQLGASDPNFLSAAEPVGAFLDQSLDRGSESQRALARAGRYFLNEADQASVAGRGTEADAFLHTAITAVDLITGFVAPVALVRDAYEAFSGKHWLTGETLSPVDRAMAIAGVATVGLGSEAFVGMRLLVPALSTTRISEQVLHMGGRLRTALLTAGFKTAEIIEHFRPRLRGAKTVEEAEKIITELGRPVRDRIASLPFRTDVELVHTAEDVNRTTLRANRIDNIEPNSLVYDVRAENPRALRFSSGQDVARGFDMAPEAAVNRILKNTNSPEEFGARIKGELNLPDFPEYVGTYQPGRTVKLRISEIKWIEKWGDSSGQLQMRLLEGTKYGPQDFKDVQTLRDFFRKNKGL